MKSLNISFEEKSTWISLAIITFIFVGYFSQVFEGLVSGNLDKAGNISGWVLGIGVLMIAAHTFIQDLNAVWVANLLLFAVFVSQVVSYALQIFYYRRGY